VNPDVLIYDERAITTYLTQPSISGVFGSCACRFNETHHTYCRDALPSLPDFPSRTNWHFIVNTDFMMFRPAAVDKALVHASALLQHGNAEFRATTIFRPMIDANRTVWIKKGGASSCRVVISGVSHDHKRWHTKISLF
jgi:hypothetical protein